MKWMIVLCALITTTAFGQKLEKNEVDEFTKISVKETSWKALWEGMQSQSYVMARQNGDSYFLYFRYMDGKVLAMEKGAEMLLKTDTDSVIVLKNFEYTISCRGCGAKGLSGSGTEGLQLTFELTQVQMLYLKQHNVTKLRFYTTKNYREFEIPERNQDLIKRELELL